MQWWSTRVRGLFWITCAALLVCGRVRADAVLPDGTTVPRDSANGETQLSTYFAGEGEAIDWIGDAHTTPDTFSPLCGFTATLVLKESGSTLGVGWYNVVPGATAAPLPTDIHAIVPAGSLVGTTITGTSIRSDPAYLGGLIGFALIRTPPSFTETKWNTQCGLCAMPAPWILAVTYKSVNTPNTFYVAFEDGDTSAFGWDNDGDYNDYVFRFTGLTCAGGGEACKVDGAQGICADGLTECDAAGALVCKSLIAPEDEACDGVDNDCNGDIDEGDELCPVGERCVRGTCVPPCGEEFPCFGDDVCEGGLCVHPNCVGKTCDAGQACVGGECVAPCDGVTCPGEQVCRVGRCADPCAGVTCASGYVCDGGACLMECSCGGCPEGSACAPDGRCVDAGCEMQTCGEGQVCAAGACVDACEQAVCPRGEACVMGACGGDGDVSDGDAGAGLGGAGLGAAGVSGEQGLGSVDGGPTGGSAGSGGGASRKDSEATSGCGCHVVGGNDRRSGWPGVGLLLGVLWRWRKRRTAAAGCTH
jgi:hypothetical protein